MKYGGLTTNEEPLSMKSLGPVGQYGPGFVNRHESREDVQRGACSREQTLTMTIRLRDKDSRRDWGLIRNWKICCDLVF